MASAFSSSATDTDIDSSVKHLLECNKEHWHDMNISYSDGQLLYDIIVKNDYKHVLEIGTSTGLSGIWIAWALSKTGGTLITIEADEKRRNIALENFKNAGVEKFIDARLANAHDLVPALDETFDFVFSDADKDWYEHYFLAVSPKLTVGGCFVTHNVLDTWWNSMRYQEFLTAQEGSTTTIDKASGMSFTYK